MRGGGISKSGENLNHFAPLKHGSSDWEDQTLEQNINKCQKTPWKIKFLNTYLPSTPFLKWKFIFRVLPYVTSSDPPKITINGQPLLVRRTSVYNLYTIINICLNLYITAEDLLLYNVSGSVKQCQVLCHLVRRWGCIQQCRCKGHDK